MSDLIPLAEWAANHGISLDWARKIRPNLAGCVMQGGRWMVPREATPPPPKKRGRKTSFKALA